jgi:rhamnosyltransferase
LFEDHPNLGLLSPPVPLHGPYFPTTGLGEWGENFAVTKETAKKLGICAPMDEKCEPVAPLGSEFWVRTKALKVLFDHDWQYEEFPKEPVAIDGTVLHAIERLYPFAAQSEGYYSAWLLSDSYARIHMDNWAYMANGLVKAEAERTGGWKPFREFLSRTQNS